MGEIKDADCVSTFEKPIC
ncbi:MAG: hypothetical protein QXO32_06375 [Candidatus Bathyarchaeia archaeon]